MNHLRTAATRAAEDSKKVSFSHTYYGTCRKTTLFADNRPDVREIAKSRPKTAVHSEDFAAKA
jgi:hypothetical protein